MAARYTGSMLCRIASWDYFMGTLSPLELDHTRSHGKLGKILLKKKPRGAFRRNIEKNMTDFSSIKPQKTLKYEILAISYPKN